MDARTEYRIVNRVNSACEPIRSRRPDPRKGLNQILELEDLVMDPASPSSSGSPDAPTLVDSPPAEEAVHSEARLEEGETVESSMIERNVIEGGSSTADIILSSPDHHQTSVVFSSADDDVESATERDGLLALPNFGGAVSLFNATGAAMMGMRQTLMTGPPAVWQGLVSRVQTTLRGSADDIGWLQKDPTLPPVVDKTERFVQLLGRISHGVHVLPNNLVYLLIPGLFSNHGPLYFVDAKKYFSKLGLPCYIARIHSEAAVETNARELKDYIEELYWGTGKRVILLGHSKGGVDAAAACAMFWSELKDKVVGLVFAQSPYGGSPVASDILREGQIADFETRRILEVIITRVIKGDMQSLEDLTYDKRREFVAKHPLPSDLLTVSFHTEASRAPSVLATMSHIAHAELSWLPGTSSPTSSEEPASGTKLPVVIPLAAAMALCAIHLDLRYGEKSDGLVARKDAEVPGSVAVRPDKKLDHAWMVYAPSRKERNDPDSSQMCEALLTLLLEEEADRKVATSSEQAPLLGESSNVPHTPPATTSEEIQMGEDYLEKL